MSEVGSPSWIIGRFQSASWGKEAICDAAGRCVLGAKESVFCYPRDGERYDKSPPDPSTVKGLSAVMCLQNDGWR